MPETAEEAEERFEAEMGQFEDVADTFNIDVEDVDYANNTVDLSGTLPSIENINNTGLFTALAEQGIETIAINGGASITVSDGGVPTGGALTAGIAIYNALSTNGTVSVTVNLPLANGTTAPVTYTFNLQP